VAQPAAGPPRRGATREQAVFLRRIARKTWAYFEQFVVEEDHWLPPDNFQEQPGPVIAHRTSPTNIGIAQLAALRPRTSAISRSAPDPTHV
jgi:hypothetical protein